MKKKLLVILLAIIVGFSFSYIMYLKPKKDNIVWVDAKAFQVGVFSGYDNALKCAERNNGIVVEDNNMYRVYISILSNEEAIKYLSNFYDSKGINYYIKDIKVNRLFVWKIKKYEEDIIKQDEAIYSETNINILKEYQEYK